MGGVHSRCAFNGKCVRGVSIWGQQTLWALGSGDNKPVGVGLSLQIAEVSVFVMLYILYTIMSIVLLLNLLIAMMQACCRSLLATCRQLYAPCSLMRAPCCMDA